MELPSYTKTWHHGVYPAIDPTRPELSLANKVVVITGGGQGIGAANVKAFAKAGASHIAIIGRKEATLNAVKSEVEATSKTPVHVYPADVTDEAGINHVFADVEKKFGKIGVLVHNAGYLADPGPIAGSSVADLWKPFEVNIKGTLITALAFLKSAAPDAVYIYINSAAAIIRYFGPMATYSASKAGAARIVESLAVEHPGMRFYNLQPGVVPTDMATKSGVNFQDMDSPDLPASFAVWLASPEGALVKGRFVYANWDVEEMKQNAKDFEDPDFLTVSLKGYQNFAHSHLLKF